MKKHRKILKTFLKEVRTEHQLLQKDICEFTTFSQGYISRLENGKTDCSIRALNRIVEGLGHKLVIKIKRK